MIIPPCISICKTDPVTGYCYGCGRSNEDKKMWKDEKTTNEWKKNNLLQIEKRLKGGGIGFDRNIHSLDKNELIKHVQPEDLVKYGFIPELVGRLPINESLNLLSSDTLKRILIEPKNSIIKQYQKLFEMEGIELSFTDDAINDIVDIAIERKTGARALRSILEKSMQDIMYEIPSLKNISKCIITSDVILKRSKPKILKLRKTG